MSFTYSDITIKNEFNKLSNQLNNLPSYDNVNTTPIFTGFVDFDIVPTVDSYYNLGSLTHRFKDLYLSGNTIYLGDSYIKSNNGAILLPIGSTIGGVSPGTIKIMGTFEDANLLSTLEQTAVGDGYIINRELYVCTVNNSTQLSDWTNVGLVEGPKGDNGPRGPYGLTGPRGESAKVDISQTSPTSSTPGYPGQMVLSGTNLYVYDGTNWYKSDLSNYNSPTYDTFVYNSNNLLLSNSSNEQLLKLSEDVSYVMEEMKESISNYQTDKNYVALSVINLQIDSQYRYNLLNQDNQNLKDQIVLLQNELNNATLNNKNTFSFPDISHSITYQSTILPEYVEYLKLYSSSFDGIFDPTKLDEIRRRLNIN
jgi:hypothetical protein